MAAENDDVAPTLRSLLPAQHGSFCADARSAVRVTLAPASFYADPLRASALDSLPPRACFAPTFTHQVF
jgi:hypothetical protein